MARRKKRSRSRSRAVVRRSAARGASASAIAPRRSRRRRAGAAVARFRPSRAGLRSVIPFTVRATVGAAEVMGGIFIARKARGLAKLTPGTPFAMLAEFAAGIGAGLIASRFVSAEVGERIAIGGVLAPMLTAVQRLNVKGVSDALGDDGFILDGGVTLDESSGVAGYVGGGVNDGLGGYVPGRDWANVGG